jgi:replication factor A1
VLSSKTVPQKGRPGAAAGPAARPTRIAECLIGDEIGCILFTARNEQGMIRSPFLQ